jgi:hypothetical protein
MTYYSIMDGDNNELSVTMPSFNIVKFGTTIEDIKDYFKRANLIVVDFVYDSRQPSKYYFGAIFLIPDGLQFLWKQFLAKKDIKKI